MNPCGFEESILPYSAPLHTGYQLHFTSACPTLRVVPAQAGTQYAVSLLIDVGSGREDIIEKRLRLLDARLRGHDAEYGEMLRITPAMSNSPVNRPPQTHLRVLARHPPPRLAPSPLAPRGEAERRAAHRTVHASRETRVSRKRRDTRLPALHRGTFRLRAALPGQALAWPRAASSSQSGHSAARAGSRSRPSAGMMRPRPQAAASCSIRRASPVDAPQRTGRRDSYPR